MRISSHLPAPPHFDIEVVKMEELGPEGFLRPIRRVCRTRDGEGRLSQSFVYDEVDRAALDAVVIVPHFLQNSEERGATRYVVLRSATRPPVVLRRSDRSSIPEPKNRALWEVPAGLVEEKDGHQEDFVHAAARELLEETGFNLPPSRMHSLGHSSFPAPGVIAERHYYFQAVVDPLKQSEPSLDGSPLEEAGVLIAVPLKVALNAARSGKLSDAKTELALRRLQEELGEEEQ